MGMLEVNSTKHYSWLEAACVKAAILNHLKLGLGVKPGCMFLFMGWLLAKITIRRFKDSHFKGSMRENNHANFEIINHVSRKICDQ